MATFSTSVTVDVSSLADANKRIYAYCALFNHEVTDSAIETLIKGRFEDRRGTPVFLNRATLAHFTDKRMLIQDSTSAVYAVFALDPTFELTIRYNP